MPVDDYVTESYLRRQIELCGILPAVFDILLDLVTDAQWIDHQMPLDGDRWFGGNVVTKSSRTKNGAPYKLFEVKIRDRFYRPGG